MFLLPLRSRSDCDKATREGRKTKENYLKKTHLHCRGCRRDTLAKKLLVINYFTCQIRHLLYSPLVPMGPYDEDHNDGYDAMNADDDLLDSPILRDLDDFDDFEFADADDALLPNSPVLSVRAANFSLF